VLGDGGVGNALLQYGVGWIPSCCLQWSFSQLRGSASQGTTDVRFPSNRGWPQYTLGLSDLMLQFCHLRCWNPNANGASRLGEKNGSSLGHHRMHVLTYLRTCRQHVPDWPCQLRGLFRCWEKAHLVQRASKLCLDIFRRVLR
jgi:hypothetical protein